MLARIRPNPLSGFFSLKEHMVRLSKRLLQKSMQIPLENQICVENHEILFEFKDIYCWKKS